MIAVEVSCRTGVVRGGVEHPADRWHIDDASVHTEANNAAGKLIHDDHYPMGFQRERFTAKKIHTPQTVLGISEKRQPRWAAGPMRWAVVLGEYTPHDVLVDCYIEGERKLLPNTPATEPRISSFHLDDRVNQFARRSRWTGLSAALRGEQ